MACSNVNKQTAVKNVKISNVRFWYLEEWFALKLDGSRRTNNLTFDKYKPVWMTMLWFCYILD